MQAIFKGERTDIALKLMSKEHVKGHVTLALVRMIPSSSLA
jgi:hypothetical protein